MYVEHDEPKVATNFELNQLKTNNNSRLNVKAVLFMSKRLFDDDFIRFCLAEAYKQGLNVKQQSVLLHTARMRLSHDKLSEVAL